MAAYTGKAVVTSAKITFAGTAYDCKSIPSGIPETCEPPNVTVLTGVEPSTIEAGGDRVLTWTVTFKPNGSRS